MNVTILPKTIEFPYPGAIPPNWLTTADRIWNRGLHLLEWRQYWLRRQKCLAVLVNGVESGDRYSDDLPPIAIEYTKQSGEWAMCSQLGRDQRIDKAKSWDKDNLIFILSTRLVPRAWMQEPPINAYTTFTLCKQFTKKSGFDYGDMPSGIMQSVVRNLCDTWAKYQKGTAGKPKYRGKKNPIKSLSYDGFRQFCKLSDDTVKLLCMPVAKIPSLATGLTPLIEATAQYLIQYPSDRVLEKAKTIGLEGAARFYAIPGAFNLVQNGDKTVLQLSGEFVESKPAAKIDKKISITSTDRHLWVTEEEQVMHHDTDSTDERIKRLQQILAKKEYGSKAWFQVSDKIRSLQRRSRKAVRSRQHYHAQLLATNCEIKICPHTPILPAPVPIPDGEGGYAPNGASAIAEANERRQKAATAQFISLIGNAAKKTGAVVIDQRKSVSKQKKGRNRKKEKAIG